MPPILSSVPQATPAAKTIPQANWLLPACLLLLLLLLSRWSRPALATDRRPLASTEMLGRLPQPVLAVAPTSAL